jgi:hypothetical protein
MSDVYAVFGTLLALGIAFPGLIFTWWLLFPVATARAEARLAHMPGRSFFFGLLLTLILTILVLILANLPLPGTNLLAGGLVIGALAVAAVGAVGLTNRMAQRLRERSGAGLSAAGSFLRAVVLLELAAAFPIIGWFLFIPLCLVTCLGVAGLALLRRVPHDELRPVVTAVGVSDVA